MNVFQQPNCFKTNYQLFLQIGWRENCGFIYCVFLFNFVLITPLASSNFSWQTDNTPIAENTYECSFLNWLQKFLYCSSAIYGFWLPLWCLQTFLVSMLFYFTEMFISLTACLLTQISLMTFRCYVYPNIFYDISSLENFVFLITPLDNVCVHIFFCSRKAECKQVNSTITIQAKIHNSLKTTDHFKNLYQIAEISCNLSKIYQYQRFLVKSVYWISICYIKCRV